MSSNRLMSRTTIKFSSNRQTSLENSWHMGSRIAELLSEKCVGRPIPSPIRQQRLEVTALFHVDTHNFAGFISFGTRLKWTRMSIYARIG